MRDQNGSLHGKDGRFAEDKRPETTVSKSLDGALDPVDSEVVESLNGTVQAINEDIADRARILAKIATNSPEDIPGERLISISHEITRKQSMVNAYEHFNYLVEKKGMGRHRALASAVEAAHNINVQSRPEVGRVPDEAWRDGALAATLGISRLIDVIERDNGVNL
ncbi:hypothetical protein [Aeromicrobium sp. 179-A 4D2 NHS]|uniref:hypothetical protein n=1 Tax=Aeromicrobium sp. 179-A 4D2 NHS TaxID=3142375 RepID=UPI0039A1C1AB